MKYLRSRSVGTRGEKAAGFVKMADVEKGIKGEDGAKNKLERQETDTSAEVGHESQSACWTEMALSPMSKFVHHIDLWISVFSKDLLPVFTIVIVLIT